MRFIDTYNDILASFPTGVFELSGWREYAARISNELVDKAERDAQGYHFCNEVMPVIQAAISDKVKMNMTHASFCSVTQDLDRRFVEKFGTDLNVNVILYLGLCNGAGWATTLDDQDVVLLGMEKIIELDWCGQERLAALIFHELGHIWHKTVGILYHTTDKPSEKSIWQLYQEGLAMVCEQILWGNPSYYHQARGDWLDWCLENEVAIKHEFLRRINYSESTQDFFGDWCSYEGYSDVGYFLGCQFVKRMCLNRTLTEVANMDIPDLLYEFTYYATEDPHDALGTSR